MRTSSQRRPKSPAASVRAQLRTRTPDIPPWDNSVHAKQRRATSTTRIPSRTTNMLSNSKKNNNHNNDVYRQYEGASLSLQRTPEHTSYENMMSTPAAALAANAPPSVGGFQVELLTQLQDVVVRLSQSAVGEKQRLSHMQQRLDAYAALVREQDHMIDELRGMNIKLQKEKDTLIAFRQQSLNHDFHVMNHLENDGGIDEEVCRAFAQHEGRQSSYGMSFNNSLGTMTPQVRSFVRSLVAQLRDERRKRLEVEEQSSRMIGEQQLTIQRLEDRLRPQTTSLTRNSVFGRVEGTQTSCKNGISTEVSDLINKDHHHPHFPIDRYRSPSRIITTTLVNTASEDAIAVSSNPVSASVRTSTTIHDIHKDEMAEQATLTASPVQPISFPHSRQEVHVSTTPLLSSVRSDVRQEEREVEVPLAIHGTTYEDAESILSNIRRRHGL
ncbi:uncharacterized protein TM35_000024050 [Trypanosoma theileri]|uniref:Uncharacterized protein n=1 Tax=Trypanosoma theileri TaxID=67003 RepID=A0A1X0P917_9TRYP|nr:uncharacterized protein TM35_000024050 [Trypanosoma theileri]ORC93079.1 hypothetical protein TM35_000024050 [Trypanosoma theileri]